LKEALDLDPDLGRERYMIGKEVAAAADANPRGALEVTIALLSYGQDAPMLQWDLTRNAVPFVIARAISAGDDDLK
jgi:hypothetical protein